MSYTLDELCYIEKGKIGITKAVDGEYPLVTTGESFGTHNEYHFEGPAVCVPLVSSTGHGHASIKRLQYVEGKFACGNILAVLIPKDPKKLSAKYLYTYLTIHKEEKLVREMKGAANVSLTLAGLGKVRINSIPPYNQQTYISEVFSQVVQKSNDLLNIHSFQMDRIDSLWALALRKTTQGVIDSTEIDGKSWSWIDFDKKFDIQGGSQPDKSFFRFEPYEGSVQLYQIRDFGDKSQPVYVDKSSVTKFFTYDDVLIGRYGASIGKIFTGKSGAYNVALVKLIFSKEDYLPKYVYYLFQSEYLQKFFASTSRSAQAGFNKKNIAKWKMPLPSISEQKTIISSLDSLYSKLRNMKKIVESSKSTCNMLPKGVLVDYHD